MADVTFKTARLNSKHPEEAQALAYIRQLEAQGYNFKQIAVDAINRAAGATPEMFSKDTTEESAQLLEAMEALFEKFAADLLKRVGTPQQGFVQHEPDSGSGTVSAYGENVGRKLLQLQQMIGEDDE